jgi:inorganic pyrophosphatase
MSHTILLEISPFDKGDKLHVIIETPKGSRNEYSYDPECNCLKLATVLPE